MGRKQTDRNGPASENDGCQGQPAWNLIMGIGFEDAIGFAGESRWDGVPTHLPMFK